MRLLARFLPDAEEEDRRLDSQPVECWLSDTDTRMIAIVDSSSNYQLMLGYNPGWFQQVGRIEEAKWTVVGVNAPYPLASECGGARSASR